MKKYDNYKDSGVEWIGKIPEHWDRIRIKSLVAIKVTDGPHETPQWIENGVPFISAEAIKGNKIDLFFHTSKECYSFGRRKVKVYVLQ